jgi:hypothetical protein
LGSGFNFAAFRKYVTGDAFFGDCPEITALFAKGIF